MQDDLDRKLQIVVLSFDGFHDLWPIFFNQFFHYWSDCPFKVNLITNHLNYDHPRVTCLRVGNDISWSDNLIKAIRMIESERILFFFEDAFLKAKVSTAQIIDFLNFCIAENADYLRLKVIKKPNIKYTNRIGILKNGGLYRLTLFLSIIKKDVLLELIVPGESAWEFEFNGTVRSDTFKKFYSVYNNCIQTEHAIIKGKWTKNVVKTVEKFGIDINERGLTDDEDSSLLNRLKLFFLLELIPTKLQRKALNVYHRIKYLK